MEKYFAYGLLIESEISLTPLNRCTSFSQAATTQVVIRQGTVSKQGLEAHTEPKESRAFAQIGQQQVWLNMPNICRMLISSGTEIIVEAYEGADEQSIRLYIQGSGIGAILHQRGLLVLHASAVAIRQADCPVVVLFAGRSGAGKSTTEAVLHQRGYDMVSDDVVANDGKGHAIGGLPQIKQIVAANTEAMQRFGYLYKNLGIISVAKGLSGAGR